MGGLLLCIPSLVYFLVCWLIFANVASQVHNNGIYLSALILSGAREPWDWHGKNISLGKTADFEISEELWNDVPQNEEDLSYMLDDETTPVKACGDLAYNVSNADPKEPEECRETYSQAKRRRMLQFNSQDSDQSLSNEEMSLSYLKNGKEDPVKEIFPEVSQWVSGASDYTIGNASASDYVDLESTETWLADYFNDAVMDFSPEELNFSVADGVQIDDGTEVSAITPSHEQNVVQQTHVPRTTCNIIFKGQCGLAQVVKDPELILILSMDVHLISSNATEILLGWITIITLSTQGLAESLGLDKTIYGLDLSNNHLGGYLLTVSTLPMAPCLVSTHSLNMPVEPCLVVLGVSPHSTTYFIPKNRRKSFIHMPTKLASSVAYPFAFIKPSGAHGDVTLKEINQRIQTPSPSKSNQSIDDDPSAYPKSAFSGKPVVGKTKIRTEGGKGSITITRTKG
ncbi:Protein XRI1 [Glycine max]|nr:Protein XRI1 [Glycine max]KAH1256772.1 Protein XRI1 [Glycine max]